jgi:hypothetical protein
MLRGMKPTFRRLTNNFGYACFLRSPKALGNGDHSFQSLLPE